VGGEGANGALWTAVNVTALLSPLLSCLGSRDCFRVSDLWARLIMRRQAYVRSAGVPR